MLEGNTQGAAMSQSTISVNGKLYDVLTGLPVEGQPENQTVQSPANRTAVPSRNIHKKATISQTSGRRAKAPTMHTIQRRADMRRPVVIDSVVKKSPAISKFTPPHSSLSQKPRVVNDIQPATPHPLAERAHARMQEKAKANQSSVMVKPSEVIKKEAINDALNKSPQHNPAARMKKRRMSRLFSFASVGLSVLLLAGYLTYINLPNISVRVAAAQAGIDASYPSYKPDGYRLAGVNYDKGTVSLEFAANAGPHTYTVTQQQTSWDSTAVKENYVKTKWGDNVVPYSERGLTIYAHNGNAAWVNGGILYTITGDAPLSTSQVRNIATSL